MDGTPLFRMAMECARWWKGSINFYHSVWEPPIMCVAWKMLVTDGREVNKKGACLKISFISVLKIELWHLYKSLLPSAKGLSIYFYVESSPSY